VHSLTLYLLINSDCFSLIEVGFGKSSKAIPYTCFFASCNISLFQLFLCFKYSFICNIILIPFDPWFEHGEINCVHICHVVGVAPAVFFRCPWFWCELVKFSFFWTWLLLNFNFLISFTLRLKRTNFFDFFDQIFFILFPDFDPVIDRD